MKTKILSLIVVITMLMSLIPVSAEVRDHQTINDNFDNWTTVTPDSNTYRGFNIQGGKEYTILTEPDRGNVISMDAGEYLDDLRRVLQGDTGAILPMGDVIASTRKTLQIQAYADNNE